MGVKLALIGKTEAEAIEEIISTGMKVRVFSRDRVKLDPFNNSYNFNRVNLEIENGVVVNAFVR